jgi:hypothetical protein
MLSKRVRKATDTVLDQNGIIDPAMRDLVHLIKNEDIHIEIWNERQRVKDLHFENKRKREAEKDKENLTNESLGFYPESFFGAASIIENTDREDNSIQHPSIFMANELNKQQHCLSLNEKRIIAVAASKIKREHNIENSSPVMRVAISDLVNTYGMEKKSSSKALREASETLITKHIRWVHVNEDGSKLYNSVIWSPEVSYNPQEGYLDVALWHKIVPYLISSPKGNFFNYSLEGADSIQSKHTWRLFEILHQWKNFKGKFIEIKWDDLAFMLELKASYANSFALTKSHIFEKAVNELKNKLPFSYEPVRRGPSGKKVISVRFKLLPIPATVTLAERLKGTQELIS